jgi:hypothetical protein
MTPGPFSQGPCRVESSKNGKAPSVAGGALKNVPCAEFLAQTKLLSHPHKRRKTTMQPIRFLTAVWDDLGRLFTRDQCRCQPNISFERGNLIVDYYLSA